MRTEELALQEPSRRGAPPSIRQQPQSPSKSKRGIHSTHPDNLEQDENQTVILLTYEVNGTTFEVTITTALLWSYNELAEQADRIVRFTSTEITTQDWF